jgi:hypothetical protein
MDRVKALLRRGALQAVDDGLGTVEKDREGRMAFVSRGFAWDPAELRCLTGQEIHMGVQE